MNEAELLPPRRNSVQYCYFAAQRQSTDLSRAFTIKNNARLKSVL